MLNYLQEYEEILQRRGQCDNRTFRQEDPTINRLLAMMESMRNLPLPVDGKDTILIGQAKSSHGRRHWEMQGPRSSMEPASTG